MASKNPLEEHRTLFIATRGSALALAQATHIQSLSQELFPDHTFELRVIRTTGDQLQALQDDQSSKEPLPKGLFTKELEAALLNGKADMAIHSLKDLPTELPPKLCLGAITAREDAREILILKKPVDAAIAHPSALLSQQGCCGHQQPQKSCPNQGLGQPRRGRSHARQRANASGKARLTEKTACHSFGLGRAQPTGLPAGREWTTDGQRRTGGTLRLCHQTRALAPLVRARGFWASKSVNRIPSWHRWSRRWRIPLRPAQPLQSAVSSMPWRWMPNPYAALASWAQPDRLILKGRAFHGPSCVEAELGRKSR